MTKSSLPKGWRSIKFGDIVDNMNETTRDPESIGLDRVVGLDHMDPESLPLKRWDNFSDLHEGTSFTRVFRAGQVLFGKRRAYQRKVSLPDFDGICSGDILVFQPKNAELLPEFLPYLVQSDGFFDHALGTSAGSLSPRTKWQELAKYEFSLPPIAEQRRIVSLMLSTNRLQLQSIEALAAAEKQLSNVCIRLTTTTKGGSKNIEEVAEILDSQRVPVNDAERSKRNGEIPYYGSNGQVGWIDEPLFSEPLTLVAEDAGYFSDWRKSPIAYRIDGPSWVNNHAHVLRATCVPAGWLYFSLRNRDLTKIIVGTTRTKLNRKALSGLNIEMPEDLHQRLAILEKFEDVVQRLSGKVMDEKILGKTLLNRLLSGESF